LSNNKGAREVRQVILACGTLSYRQESLGRALEGIARAGFRWVEISCVCGYCEHITPETMSPADADRLAKQAAQFGLGISSIAGHVDLKYPLLGKGEDIAATGFHLLRKRIDLASHLRVGIVNTGIGEAREESELDAFYRDFDALLTYAEQRRVKIGLESHAGLTETAQASLALCRRMGRASLGVNYDAGNVHWCTGMNPLDDLGACADEIADWLIHVHIKDHRGGKGVWDFPPLGEGDVDLAGLVRLLRRIGYDGPCSLEIEFQGPESQDPAAEIIDRGIAESYRFLKDLGLEDQT
jgi:sugar phosphate isomerase/epimerase